MFKNSIKTVQLIKTVTFPQNYNQGSDNQNMHSMSLDAKGHGHVKFLMRMVSFTVTFK